MGIKNWLNKKIAAVSIAFSNVEKNFLNQNGDAVYEMQSHQKRQLEGTLADALVHGELTQEVKNLRWSNYKILRASENTKLTQVSTDKDGNKYYKVEKLDGTQIKRKIKVDNYDDYEVEMIFYNPKLVSGLIDDLESFTEEDRTIDSDTYSINYKTNTPLTIKREILHRFDIERYTKKLIIRKIDDDKKMLEFYISKYGYPEQPISKHFSKELLKLLKGQNINKDFLEIKEVSFVSNKTLGCVDFLKFSYNIESFDKIVEFDGNYILKFIGNISIDGLDMLTEFVEEDLEKKYNNKEKKII